MPRLHRNVLRTGPLLMVLPAAPAAAEDLAGAFAFHGGAALVSDYRFRGISQTNKCVAIQGTFTLSHSSGIYGTVWGSSIDDYVANGSDAEIDLVLGYKRTLGSTTFDGGLLYYYYPGSGGASTNFAEPYLHFTQAFGPLSATASIAFAPRQKALGIDERAGVIHERENLYLAGDLGYAFPKSPLALTAHFGHSFGPSNLTIGKEYSDWSLGATLTHKSVTAGISYVETNKSLYSPSARNIAGAGVVASLAAAF